MHQDNILVTKSSHQSAYLLNMPTSRHDASNRADSYHIKSNYLTCLACVAVISLCHGCSQPYLKRNTQNANIITTPLVHPFNQKRPQSASKTPATQANTIDSSGTSSGRIDSTVQEVYIKIIAPTGSLASFSLKSTNDLYPIMELINKSNKVVARNSSFDESSSEIGLFSISNSQDDLFLRVRSQIPGKTGTFEITAILASRLTLKNNVLQLTNIERSKHGLQPLSYSHTLEKSAQMHAEDLSSSKTLSHIGSNGSRPIERIKEAGYKAAWHKNTDGSLTYPSPENVASGYSSADKVVRGWMNSPGHRDAILSPYAKELGVGIEVDDSSGITYWVQNFGIPWSEGDTRYF